MMDKFEESEIVGRVKADCALKSIESIFEDGYDEYNIIPTDKKCQWDFEIRDKGNNQLLGIVEAKDRQMSSYDNRILSYGCQLEAQKYNALMEIVDKKAVPAFYLATFTDRKFYLWNIEECNLKEDIRECNKTTAVNRGKVAKHCYYFNLNEAFATGAF